MENTTVTRPGEPLGGLLLSNGEVASGKRHRRSLRIRNALVACGLRLEGKRVLDIGCAEGLHSLYFAGRAAEVVGIDHRQSKILIARPTPARSTSRTCASSPATSATRRPSAASATST